jgi:hypothetical protein
MQRLPSPDGDDAMGEIGQMKGGLRRQKCPESQIKIL